MRFYIKLRFTLCFKRGGLRPPLKESAKLWPPPTLPQHCSSLPHTAVQSYNFSTACNVHCSTTSWYKCSALNSGASLKRGRKFTTGISSRHESWQKIQHIPHPPHISTLSTCSQKKTKERISKISWRRTRKGAWERCRETFQELWLPCWLETTLSIGHQRHLYWLLKVTSRGKAG